MSQIYLGTPDTIAQQIQSNAQLLRPNKIKTEEFGSLFILHELEKQLDTIGIIDGLIKRHPREKGPSVGEYFFYAWLNRLVDPKSKRALGDWYQKTAIQHIRPVDLSKLDSEHYWEKWDRVSEQDIEKIARAFFEKVWKSQKLPPECVLFDTSNYYTYMASHTESELCQRGKNKARKDHLRQVGLALLVDRTTQIPLYYKAYEGNRHDSKVFRRIIDEMFGIMCNFNKTKQRLTIVFDKGMNSDDNMEVIDDHQRVHFITSYSPYFVEDLSSMALKHFFPVATRGNLKLEAIARADDRITAYRSKIELWGVERTIIVTHNPVMARKRKYTLARKLESLRESLLEFRKNYREAKVHWRKPDDIRRRYERLCERLHIESHYYEIEFGDRRRSPELSFKKNSYQIKKATELFGRNVIVTDNHDWSTDEIVQLSLDRYFVERQFRASNDRQHVSMKPFFHWTDGKIRCQLLSCVIALTIMSLLELKMVKHQVKTPLGSTSGPAIIKELRSLHSILSWYPKKRAADRCIETPSKTQSEALKAFGWRVTPGGVLQQLAS